MQKKNVLEKKVKWFCKIVFLYNGRLNSIDARESFYSNRSKMLDDIILLLINTSAKATK